MGEWVRRTGSFSLACMAHSRASALPARAPSALTSSYAAGPAQRSKALVQGGLGRDGVVVGEWGHLVGHGVGGHEGTTMPGYRDGVTSKARVRRALLRVPGAMPAARLTVETIRVCLRYRVTGLASEAGFFMLLSLPPLRAGAVRWCGLRRRVARQRHRQRPHRRASRTSRRAFLVANVVDQIILPTAQRRAPERAAATSSRSASCCRSGRGRGPSTCSSTPSRSCTGSPACGGSCGPGRCR